MDVLSSPSAKHSKEHRCQPGVVAAVRRALFPIQAAGSRGLRLRAAAAAVGTTLLLLLLTAWAGKLQGSHAIHQQRSAGPAEAARAKVLWQQPKWVARVAALHTEQAAPAAPSQQAAGPHQQTKQGGGAKGTAAPSGPAEAVVEFTAPGLFLPLR